MPVEFAVAAYRFGHSMIRDTYWVNFNFPAATLGQVFEFNRVPRLPVFSNWVVDFNAFFDTGRSGAECTTRPEKSTASWPTVWSRCQDSRE